MSSMDRDGSIRPWSFARRLTSVLALSTSLVAGTVVPAEARGGRGGGGAMRGGGGGAARSSGGMHQGGGGAARSATPAARPSAPSGAASRPSAPSGNAASRPATQGRTGNVNASGNRNVNSGNRNVNSGNRNVNVNRGGDVNINRNTAVRAAPRPYARAPYAYGGHRYYAHNAYRYHGYRGYGWGVGFRPFGAFVATVAATAVVVSVANSQYWYNAGVWYAPASGGYTVVTAPVGATVTTLPSQAVVVNENNYYYGGTYYEKTGGSYKVVAPVAGTVVEHLPEGGEEVTIGEQKYVKFGETYYQPIQKDGKNMYEVVEVK